VKQEAKKQEAKKQEVRNKKWYEGQFLIAVKQYRNKKHRP